MSVSDDSWDSAVYHSGTLRAVRSSSAINNHRHVERPTSKLSDSVAVCRKGLDRYRRSLRLLGLSIENEDQATINRRPQTRSAKSKIQTRLERRTVSSEDIKTALVDERKKEEDIPSRGLVCRAVYEEWYFRKVEQARSLIEAKLQQEKIKRWQEDNERKEKEKKGQLSYEEWLKKKDDEKKQLKPEPKNTRGKAMVVRRPVSKEAAIEAYTKWKEEKKQLELKRKAEEKKKKEEEEEKERKRIEAEKAFESWKKRTEESMKKAAKEAEENRKLKEEDEIKLKEQKEKEAASSFRAWKEAKDKEIKEKLDKQRYCFEIRNKSTLMLG
ncbi:uncharacterized protein isoform X2 [Rhodnius prolixus]|uniref:uncharacterized protein isoform X2 n=1 Tax=Rhodnius prolixus TaxID=13249 RepID=UPI003D18A461